MKRKTIRNLTILLLIAAMLLSLSACQNGYTVSYSATEGGNITGELSQKITKGGDGSEVTAVPNEGYFFVRWSDGFRYPARQEKDVQNKTTIKAIFAPKIRIYKILMVYVTEIKATLTTADGTDVEVDYRLTETELKICELTSVQMSAYLNDMMDGHVYFEVDSYFTTVPLTEESIWKITADDLGKPAIHYIVDATSIPELIPDGVTDIGQMFTEYNSVITTFSFNDWEYLLRYGAGSAGRKYASVHLEGRLSQFVVDGVPLESLFDLTFESDRVSKMSSWDLFMSTFIHEFIHTIEIVLAYEAPEDYMDYHHVLSAYMYDGTTYPSKLYLLNQAVLDGKTGGIPEWYWEQFRVN